MAQAVLNSHKPYRRIRQTWSRVHLPAVTAVALVAARDLLALVSLASGLGAGLVLLAESLGRLPVA
jgi:hypothetical protein